MGKGEREGLRPGAPAGEGSDPTLACWPLGIRSSASQLETEDLTPTSENGGRGLASAGTPLMGTQVLWA